MRSLFAIDPGPTESALLRYDLDAAKPVWWEKLPNYEVLRQLELAQFADVREADRLAVEMIASYGMAVGQEVFETCVWVGRFIDRWCGGNLRDEPIRVTRMQCKVHLCHSLRAGDKNIRAALIDRFGPGKELAVGKKATPGPLYGLTGDCWAALAVAVTVADTTPELTAK